jgi:DNA (cytosine-5)-methyltransferase 1
VARQASWLSAPGVREATFPPREPGGTSDGRKYRVVDLFCGAGGLSEGFRQAGYQIVAANDVDPDACATFHTNFPEAHVVCGDLRAPHVHEEILRASAGSEIVVGGPPCQAFSQVRNHVRVIDDPRNSLYREFVDVVRILKPQAFVMENVPGLDQMGVREQILQDLSLETEYRVVAQVLDAADFGVPQTRKRLIFIGVRRALSVAVPTIGGSGITRLLSLSRRNGDGRSRYEIEPNSDLPAEAHELLSRLADSGDVVAVTARQAISDLESLKAGDRQDTVDFSSIGPPRTAYQSLMRKGPGQRLQNISVPRMNADTKIRLSKIPGGGNYRDLPEELRERYISGDKWGPHNGSGVLGRRHFYAYRRLYADFWAWTLNTKADSVYHYSSRRALSVREFARLQSFPDRFVFTTDPKGGELPGRVDGGANHSRYRQAGNAVPPLVAKAIAERLAASLALQMTEPATIGRSQSRISS